MKRYLFIAEKNSEMQAARDAYEKHRSEFIGKYGFTLDFVCLSGHIYKTWEPRDYEEEGWNDSSWGNLLDTCLPMIPSEWKIKPIDTKSAEQARERLDKAFRENSYDGLISGCDPDQEGTGIFELCRLYRHWEEYPTLRFGSSSMAEPDMYYALMHMIDYGDPKNLNEVKSFHFRQYWDWLIGMNYTIAYSAVLGTTIKVGSVKGPTMLLIEKNCDEIDNFKKKTDYAIVATYQEGFTGVVVDDEKKEFRFETEALAKLASSTMTDTATVLEYSKGKATTKAPKLYSLADLQADAGKKFFYSPDETLDIAQELYEMKILSYPRSDGNHITSAAASAFIGRISAIMGHPDLDPYIKNITREDIRRAQNDPNMVDDAKVEKQNHDALIPTEKRVDWGALTDRQTNIFLLVCKRFLGHFLGCMEEEKTTLLADCNGMKLYSKGRKVLTPGFSAIYQYEPEDTSIPEHKKDDILKIDAVDIAERTTTPPKRYTTASLILVMKNIGKFVTDPKLREVMRESQGIGTEATRAGIIKDLIDTGYIRIDEKKNIFITETGKYYVENLKDDSITDPMFVAYWSYVMKQIRLGADDFDTEYNEFLNVLRDGINKVKALPRHERPSMTAIGSCPHCKGDVLMGKYGPYCTKKCGMLLGFALGKKNLSEKEVTGLLSGKKTTIKDAVKKDGSKYNATVRCRGAAESKTRPGTFYYDLEFIH